MTAGQRGDGAGADAAGRALFEFCMMRDRRPDLDWDGASELQRREWCRQAERIAGPALAAANERAEAAERELAEIRAHEHSWTQGAGASIFCSICRVRWTDPS